MSIRTRMYTDEGQVGPSFLCDVCGEWIEDEGTAFMQDVDRSPILHTHKGCEVLMKASETAVGGAYCLTQEIDWSIVYLMNSIKGNWRKIVEKVKRLP